MYSLVKYVINKYLDNTSKENGAKEKKERTKINNNELLQISDVSCEETNAKVIGEIDPGTSEYIAPENCQILEENVIGRRTVVGRVDKRQGREIFFENDLRFNLNDHNPGFVPAIGDLIELQCVVEVNEDVPDRQGKILEIEEVKPVRSMHKRGKVTKYDDQLEAGSVGNIVFKKAVCSAGYIPVVGDRVVVHCIESEQMAVRHWRAVEVVPEKDVFARYETATAKHKPQLSAHENDEFIVGDEENIEITKNINVTLDATAQKEIEVVVKNNGNFKQILNKCSFSSIKSESQLTLLSSNDRRVLKPAESVTYKFNCKGRHVGVSEEQIIFKFNNFKVARNIVITVNSLNSNKIVPAESSNVCAKNDHQSSVIPRSYEDNMYIRGVPPFMAPRFIREPPINWKIPDALWSTINEIVQKRKTFSEARYILEDKVSFLKEHLNVENYRHRFHYLLYLEEIAQILDMKRFDMANAALHRSGEFLTLNVPGLAEKRPSLINGDKVIVNFKSDETGGQKCWEGYIHKIKSLDVFLRFDQTFHDNYRGEECQISLISSNTVLQSCHTAINMAMSRLGADFLFPKKVIRKKPQFNFDEAVNDDNEFPNDETNKMQNIRKMLLARVLNNEERVETMGPIVHSKKIKWFNELLNVYQKQAVTNILKGVARPLPYVIFGPPGTGKTITVCESILQIRFTMDHTRILVATPSNSAADLIAERLLDNKVLVPGDLVRLIAHHYLESDQIPEKLIPYCATADLAEEGTRLDQNIRDERGFQKNVTLSVLSRSRIIVGTCAALGILYNMGCKPGHFTHVIVDEAGQATEPQIMVPLILAPSSSSQVILAGDPNQLGPVNRSRLAGYFGLNDSFLVRLLQQFPYQRDPEGFESAYDPRLVTKLLANYRSLPELLDLPNRLFYDDELIPQVDENDSEEAMLLESLAKMLPKRLGNPLPILFHAVNRGKNMQDEDSPSWYNDEEADRVLYYLEKLYIHGLESKDVGIISPYSKQVSKIKSLLAEHGFKIPKVGSVEEFQGQERRVIILSTVRTVENEIGHALGFVAVPERLNVAITRARSLLIIIGSPKLLQKDVHWRNVLEYCKSRNSWADADG